jgi:hypothetical protein
MIFNPPLTPTFCAFETKDFIPPRHTDWFKNPIPTPDAFEEGNMANISPTIKVDISIKPGIVEEITLGVHAPLKKSLPTRLFFKSIMTFFPSHILKFLVLTQPLLNIKLTLGKMLHPVHQK